MSRLNDPDFHPEDIAKELNERLKLKSLNINKWHIDSLSTMTRNGHTITVAAWLNKASAVGETIYWLDDVEVLRETHFTGYSAQFIAADIIAAKVAEVQP